MPDIKIPVYRPDLSGNEKKYVDDCLDSTWISSKGSYIARFEESFAAFTGIKHSASVSNGTVALHVALLALGIGPGDEVIVPTLTYIASVNAITYTGAKPVFVDSLTDTWQIDPKDISKKITENTKAIMVVHLYGQASDMDEIIPIAKKHGLLIVEDCAEAIGTLYKNKHVGSFGDIATFSFFGNKTITTGEGGMVLSNDPEVISRVSRLKGQGLAEGREYWHDIIGYNYRMTNICAAIGCAQLERIENIIKRKREIGMLYERALSGPSYAFHSPAENVLHSYWMCSVLFENEEIRDQVREHLREAGIETRPLFYPVHEMPMYNIEGSFPVAKNLSTRGINLPSWPGLSDKDIENIVTKIREIVDAKNE